MFEWASVPKNHPAYKVLGGRSLFDGNGIPWINADAWRAQIRGETRGLDPKAVLIGLAAVGALLYFWNKR